MCYKNKTKHIYFPIIVLEPFDAGDVDAEQRRQQVHQDPGPLSPYSTGTAQLVYSSLI